MSSRYLYKKLEAQSPPVVTNRNRAVEAETSLPVVAAPVPAWASGPALAAETDKRVCQKRPTRSAPSPRRRAELHKPEHQFVPTALRLLMVVRFALHKGAYALLIRDQGFVVESPNANRVAHPEIAPQIVISHFSRRRSGRPCRRKSRVQSSPPLLPSDVDHRTKQTAIGSGASRAANPLEGEIPRVDPWQRTRVVRARASARSRLDRESDVD